MTRETAIAEMRATKLLHHASGAAVLISEAQWSAWLTALQPLPLALALPPAPAEPESEPSIKDIDAAHDEIELTDEQSEALLKQRAEGTAKATVPLVRFERPPTLQPVEVTPVAEPCPFCGSEADPPDDYAPRWGCGTTTSPKGIIRSSQCEIDAPPAAPPDLARECAEPSNESAGWFLCDYRMPDGTVRQRPHFWTGIHWYDDNGMCLSLPTPLRLQPMYFHAATGELNEWRLKARAEVTRLKGLLRVSDAATGELRDIAQIVVDSAIAGGKAFDDRQLYEAWRLCVKLGIKRSDE